MERTLCTEEIQSTTIKKQDGKPFSQYARNVTKYSYGYIRKFKRFYHSYKDHRRLLNCSKPLYFSLKLQKQIAGIFENSERWSRCWKDLNNQDKALQSDILMNQVEGMDVQ